MIIGATKNGICFIEFVDRKILETELKDLQKRLNATIIAGENDHINAAKRQLDDYFSNERTSFSLSLFTPGSLFQNKVWQQQSISYGETRSYSEQAKQIGNSSAISAVAAANGQNRIAIVITSHKVTAKDGSLTGYSGGLERKRWLLALEASR